MQLTDTDARRIASDWHGGMMTGLYALSSTGATALYPTRATDVSDLLAEIDECEPDSDFDMRELLALREYVINAGLRGEQEGWSDLHW